MEILKKPWFLVLVLIVSIYTYQFYSSSMDVSFSSADASTKSADAGALSAAEKSDTAEADEKMPVDVNISENFPGKNLKNFELLTYLDLKVKFSKTTGSDMILSLIGSGEDYRNDGKTLKDWFDINTRSNKLSIKSPNKNDYKGFSSLKEMAKSLQGEGEGKLTLIVEFPEGHRFENVVLETVRSDIFANDLNFKNFKSAGISSQVRILKSRGESLKVETVSGDTELEIENLQQATFTSVSGDTLLKTNSLEPKLSFESVSGDLTLALPGESEIDVTFESMTGGLSNDFGVSKKATSHLKFSSLSGDAKVTKVVQ